MIVLNLINQTNSDLKILSSKKQELLNISKKIVHTINDFENIKGRHYVSLIIVNEDKIHEINKLYRNIDRPTDVISFANIDDIENEETKYGYPVELGDIFICLEYVIKQAEEYEHSYLREFSFLLAHGMYHLLGYDHQNEEDAKVMFEKQDKVLNFLKITRDKRG